MHLHRELVLGLTQEVRNNEPQRRREHGEIKGKEIFCVSTRYK